MTEKQQDKVPKFLIRLLNILRSKEYAKIMSWDASQMGIRIHNEKRLTNEVLPRYFRHNKVSSFIRQLNMYDFHKVTCSDNSSIFQHQFFNPKKKESINFIKRKNGRQNDKVSEQKETPIPLLSYSGDKQKQNINKSRVFGSEKDRRPRRQKLKEPQDQNKSSFKVLFQSPFEKMNQNAEKSGKDAKKQVKPLQQSSEQILDEILSHIIPLKLSECVLREKIQQLRKHPRFKKFLKRGSFLCKIYAKLGIQMERQEDKLSELSIQEELLFQNSKKQVRLESLKMFESRPNGLRDTIGMFLN